VTCRLRTPDERLAHLEAALARTDARCRRLTLALALVACLLVGLAALVLRPP